LSWRFLAIRSSIENGSNAYRRLQAANTSGGTRSRRPCTSVVAPVEMAILEMTDTAHGHAAR
jgi:hypothetical protein